MPIVSVGRDKLFAAIGWKIPENEKESEDAERDFQAVCFDYGIELDDVTTEKEMKRKEHNMADDEALGSANDEILYKVDIPANRYDMLCLEGIARALNIFQNPAQNVTYRTSDIPARDRLQLTVKPETVLVRPFVVAAVLRGVTFTPDNYASFIDLQDKLHQNLCRQRSLVAIGTHDLGTLKPPFTYEALPPQDISFVPLKQTRTFNAKALLEYYEKEDAKLKKFVPLIKDSVVYPVIYDSNRTVLSLPPIINSAHSAITLNTRDVFIECTATDLTKAKTVLSTVCAMFSQYCSTPFEVEPVTVIDSLGEAQVYPDMSNRTLDVDIDYINTVIGVHFEAGRIADLLSKMALKGEAAEGGRVVRLQIPPTRSDVLHACDVAEDVAIAYGYNELEKKLPGNLTVAREQPLNQFSDLMRAECAMAGFTEVLTWALVSHKENFDFLRRRDDGDTAVTIGNPATIEFEECRTNLLGSLLKMLGGSRDAPIPIRMFELQDVVLRSDTRDVGARNERHLTALYCGKESGFEIVLGLLNRVMEVMGVPWEGTLKANADVEMANGDASDADAGNPDALAGSYGWTPSDDPAFLPGRQARIHANKNVLGHFGIVHPEVLENFGILYPVSALEINIEPFCYDKNFVPLSTHYSLT